MAAVLGIAYDPNDDIVEVALEGLDHLIHKPREIHVDDGPEGLAALEIVDADNVKQIVKLRSPCARRARRAGERRARHHTGECYAAERVTGKPPAAVHREGRMLQVCVGLTALLAMSGIAGHEAAAELLSSRPITIIIPFTPGASADTLQRIVAKKVTENTGQTLVVESRPGGGGAIGAAAVKQAPPDGHTLFQANSGSHAANAALYSTLPYDPIKDFRPITLM